MCICYINTCIFELLTTPDGRYDHAPPHTHAQMCTQMCTRNQASDLSKTAQQPIIVTAKDGAQKPTTAASLRVAFNRRLRHLEINTCTYIAVTTLGGCTGKGVFASINLQIGETLTDSSARFFAGKAPRAVVARVYETTKQFVAPGVSYFVNSANSQDQQNVRIVNSYLIHGNQVEGSPMIGPALVWIVVKPIVFGEELLNLYPFGEGSLPSDPLPQDWSPEDEGESDDESRESTKGAKTVKTASGMYTPFYKKDLSCQRL